MVIVAQSILSVQHSSVDLVRLLGRAEEMAFIRFADPRIGGILVAAAIGATLGAPLGLVTRRVLRRVPRLIFFTLLLSALWLFVRTLVLGKMAPDLAARLPFGPLLVGSIFYGACIALVPPPRGHR